VIAQRDYRDFLADIVGACRSLIRFVEGMTLEAYLADEKTRYAVMRAYEIMGEAVRHLPEELKIANPDIPGRRWLRCVTVSPTPISGSTTQSCSRP
jgi:uncharacterized protein with HEPN domain